MKDGFRSVWGKEEVLYNSYCMILPYDTEEVLYQSSYCIILPYILPYDTTYLLLKCPQAKSIKLMRLNSETGFCRIKID